MKTYPLAYPEITQADIDAVTSVLKSQYLSRGPVVKAFEKKCANVIQSQYASAVSSGTAGLIIALQALDVKPGDEVITVSFTVPATVNSIVAVGATPVMVDIERQTYGMCPQALEQAITKKTKAIIVVHAFGKAAQIDKLIAIAKSYNIKVIEDACEAIGNHYGNKPLGSIADIGVFAFYPNKQITSGEGGMLVSNDEELYQKFEVLKNHGRTMSGELYDQISFGWNFRLSDINAALGLSQLERIEAIIKKRRIIAGCYQQHLKNNTEIKLPTFSDKEIKSAWFVYVLQIQSPDKVKDSLANQGIQCGRYFAPVHLQPFYRQKFPQLKLKITEKIVDKCIALPFYHQLSTLDVEMISDKLTKAV
jgi:perosamine synthetase